MPEAYFRSLMTGLSNLISRRMALHAGAAGTLSALLPSLLESANRKKAKKKKKKKKRNKKRKKRSSSGVLGTTDCQLNGTFTPLAWPFDSASGPWFVLNGYKGFVDHGNPVGHSQLYGLDLAICSAAYVRQDIELCGNVPTQEGWDKSGTVNQPVFSPVSGKVIWDDAESIGIRVAGAPDHVVVIAHVTGLPAVGTCVSQGLPIGRVSGSGNIPHIHMSLHTNPSLASSAQDPKDSRVPIAFDGRFTIGTGCTYPAGTRNDPNGDPLPSQYLGRLVPCRGQCTNGFVMKVDARNDWHVAAVNWPIGSWHSFQVIEGQWTHWAGGRPYNPGTGEPYVCAEHFPEPQCSEPLPTSNLGALIGRVANQNGAWGEPGSIGQSKLEPIECSGNCAGFYAASVALRINDAHLGDNDGILSVCVSDIAAPERERTSEARKGHGLALSADWSPAGSQNNDRSTGVQPTPTPVP